MSSTHASHWLTQAESALQALIDSGDPFDADDLRARIGEPDSTHAPNAGNSAIGHVFRRAAAAERIEWTGEVRRSRAPTRRSGMIRVWVGRSADAE